MSTSGVQKTDHTIGINLAIMLGAECILFQVTNNVINKGDCSIDVCVCVCVCVCIYVLFMSVFNLFHKVRLFHIKRIIST